MVKNLPANAGDAGSIPGLGSFPEVGSGNPLQYSCLENSMDRGASPQGCRELDTTEVTENDTCTRLSRGCCFV